jgi:hypothetical protein
MTTRKNQATSTAKKPEVSASQDEDDSVVELDAFLQAQKAFTPASQLDSFTESTDDAVDTSIASNESGCAIFRRNFAASAGSFTATRGACNSNATAKTANDSNNDPNFASSVAIAKRAMTIIKRVFGVNQNTGKSSKMRTTPGRILKRSASFAPGVTTSCSNNSAKIVVTRIMTQTHNFAVKSSCYQRL